MNPTAPTPLATAAAAPERDLALRRARAVFLVSLVATVLLYFVPHGRRIAYPLVLVSTLAHELGHGIGALLVGGHFRSLHLHADASGTAFWSGETGRLARAFVAGAGLVGPAAAAALLLALGRGSRRSRISLGLIAAALLLTTLLVVRNLFGIAFTALLGTALALVAWKGADWLAQTTLVFLAVQLALSVFSRADYLFTRAAVTATGTGPSDVAAMAEALWLPYWLWGGVCGVLSVALLLLGMGYFLRR